jgi:hypothetical protein
MNELTLRELSLMLPPLSVLPDEPADVAQRLRNRKEVLKRHLERAQQTLVASTVSGWVVVAHPGQPEQWAKATDPDSGPEYLRTHLGILDPSTVMLMSDVPECMPGNPWTEEEGLALAEADRAVTDQIARQCAESERTRPERDARVAQMRTALRARTAEIEAKWGRLVSP